MAVAANKKKGGEGRPSSRKVVVFGKTRRKWGWCFWNLLKLIFLHFIEGILVLLFYFYLFYFKDGRNICADSFVDFYHMIEWLLDFRTPGLPPQNNSNLNLLDLVAKLGQVLKDFFSMFKKK